MSDRTQMLRYAKDLAELYRSSRTDRTRFRAVEQTCLELVRALSAEEVAQRVAQAGAELLGLEAAAVYLLRDGQFGLAARFDEEACFPALAPLTPEDLEMLGGQADEFVSPPWSTLVAMAGEAGAVVIPLLGRRRAVGFLIGPGKLDTIEQESAPDTVNLLGSHAGVVLENFLLEEKRGCLPLEGVPIDRDGVGGFEGMIGRSQRMREIFSMIERLAPVDSPVLILGETGTGKSLVAQALHRTGTRTKGPLISVNCGAIPDALVESELFGHEAGAFTGAIKRHRGKVELAHGGTLFLDEVGELPPASQVKLLSFLEAGRFSRVGGEQELTADVRIVSATNRDIESAETFRRDLLFRLNVFTIELPPLRERGGDVIAIAQSLAERVAHRYGLPTPKFGEGFRERLLAYSWQGNVRELRNVIEKSVILAGRGPLSPEDLPSPSTTSVSATGEAARSTASTSFEVASVFREDLSFAETKQQIVERWEIAYIEDVLSRTSGNIAWAARMARLDKKNLHRKLKRYGIDARAHRKSA